MLKVSFLLPIILYKGFLYSVKLTVPDLRSLFGMSYSILKLAVLKVSIWTPKVASTI